MAPHDQIFSVSSSVALRLPPGARVFCLGNALKETLNVRLARRCLQLGTEIGGGFVSRASCLTDGGDGFLDAFVEIHPGRRVRVLCPNPIGQPVIAEFINHESTQTAIIEMALCNGMALVPAARRNIMRSGTTGLGEMIYRALALGARDLHIGIGGSATCDGGIGMLMRLQSLVLEDSGNRREFVAADLANRQRLLLPQLRERLRGLNIVVYTDVSNPLLGKTGTAYTFARQKGASNDDIIMLEEFMTRWADLVETQGTESFRSLPGAGAAGGVGFALSAIGARLRPGAEAFCNLLRLTDHLENCDGLITCEGKFDETSFHGKAPYIAAKTAVANGKRAFIACAISTRDAVQRANEEGIHVVAFAQEGDRASTSEAFTGLQRIVTSYVTGVV